MMGELFVMHVGNGPRVVLLHGGVLAGELCWRHQLSLADRCTLEIVDRAGYGRSQQVSLGGRVERPGARHCVHHAPHTGAPVRPAADSCGLSFGLIHSRSQRFTGDRWPVRAENLCHLGRCTSSRRRLGAASGTWAGRRCRPGGGCDDSRLVGLKLIFLIVSRAVSLLRSVAPGVVVEGCRDPHAAPSALGRPA